MVPLLALFLVTLQALDCPPDTSEYEGQCVPTSCFFNGTICGGHGTCDDYGVCNCDKNYSPTHLGCVPSLCVDATIICNNHGTCIEGTNGKHKCECDTGYALYNSLYYCVPEICITGSWICNNSGSCIDAADGQEAYCECNSITEGQQCETCAKDGVMIDGSCVYKKCVTTYVDGTTEECGGAGLCTQFGTDFVCRCNLDAIAIGRFQCAGQTCLPENMDKGVCSGNGACKGYECLCNEGYSGEHCEKTSEKCKEDEVSVDDVCYPANCFADPSDTSTGPCNGVGKCSSISKKCNCPFYYAGDYCEDCATDSVRINGMCVDNACVTKERDGTLSVCNGHGWCLKSHGESVQCICEFGYNQVTGTLVCISNSCIDQYNMVCGNHGECIDGVCQCTGGFSGDTCENYDNCPEGQEYVLGYCVPTACVTTYWDGFKAICGGYGRCVESDDGSTICECSDGARFINSSCVTDKCITDASTDLVCAGRGQCKGGICNCDLGLPASTCTHV